MQRSFEDDNDCKRRVLVAVRNPRGRAPAWARVAASTGAGIPERSHYPAAAKLS
jgi:hypothetical protein